MDTSERLIESIRSSIIGDDQALDGPYGARRVTYADYTASGRSLAFLEDFIRHHVMPLYANTHTESSGTGRQTMRFREEARAIIKQAVGGGLETRLTGNWTAKLEYIHMDFGSLRSTPPVAVNTAVAFDANTRVTSDAVRVGVNYKFGGAIVVD